MYLAEWPAWQGRKMLPSPWRLPTRQEPSAMTVWRSEEKKQASWSIGRPAQVLGGIGTLNLQRISLLLLVVQNSVLIMTMHYSRTAAPEPGRRYAASTAVLLVEIIKLALSLSVASYEMARAHPSKSPPEIAVSVFHSCFATDSWKLVIPAGLYTLQNSLVYVAISNLETVTFQVTYQLKILTTVLFSILLLGRAISPRQWLSLVLLTVGVAIVQTSGPLSSTSTSATSSGSWDEVKVRLLSLVRPLEALPRDLHFETSPLTTSAVTSQLSLYPPTSMDSTKGLLAVLAASLISGLTCVYFEKLLKDSLSTVSLWTRNVQLSAYSIPPALFVGVLWRDGAAISRDGFFAGYGPTAWATVGLQAVGGIIVAACMAYADNVAKNFAAAASIVVCGVVGAVAFRAPVTVNSTVGTATVLLAMYLYQYHNRPVHKSLLPINKERGVDG